MVCEVALAVTSAMLCSAANATLNALRVDPPACDANQESVRDGMWARLR